MRMYYKYVFEISLIYLVFLLEIPLAKEPLLERFYTFERLISQMVLMICL